MEVQAICAIATPPGSSALGIIRISGKNLKELTKEIEGLIKERKIARENKDYKESDRIRDILLELGIEINDT